MEVATRPSGLCKLVPPSVHPIMRNWGKLLVISEITEPQMGKVPSTERSYESHYKLYRLGWWQLLPPPAPPICCYFCSDLLLVFMCQLKYHLFWTCPSRSPRLGKSPLQEVPTGPYISPLTIFGCWLFKISYHGQCRERLKAKGEWGSKGWDG